MASKNEKKNKEANKVSAGKFKGVVAKRFKARKVIYRVGDIFRTDSKTGLDNLINNGLIESSLEREAVAKLNKKVLRWKQ